MFILINSLIYIQFTFDYKSYQALMLKRYLSVIKIVDKDLRTGIEKSQINEKISSFNIKLADITIENLLSQNPIKIDFDEDDIISLYKKNKKLYIYFNPKPMHNDKFVPPKFDFNMNFNEKIVPPTPPKILLLDLSSENKGKFFWLFVLFFIDLALIWFFYFLYKKLKPLIKLKNEINKFSEGNLDIDTSAKGEDEISQVSNEFNNAIKKIRDLNSSRKLFLRNILHELKTPITKGKLISDTLDSSKRKDILQRAFLRLEYLLEEFVKLEELTSGQIELDKKEYRVVDLIDQALDILLVDREKIEIYSNPTKINVDYELFAISLKNLIDNAMKYNSKGKPEIVIKEDCLIIKNHGKPLKKTFEEYLQPFNREYESIDKGLGLGLYITDSIIKHHGFNLFYYYSNDYHIFKIQF
jgi:two-component system OmpR family sensor kinase